MSGFLLVHKEQTIGCAKVQAMRRALSEVTMYRKAIIMANPEYVVKGVEGAV